MVKMEQGSLKFYLFCSILLIFLVLVIGVLLISNHESHSYFINMSDCTTSSGGSFENEYIKFDYPPNLFIRSSSPNNNPNNTFLIQVCNNTSYTSAIMDISTDIFQKHEFNKSNANLTTISGRRAIIGPIYSLNKDNVVTISGTIVYIEFKDDIVITISLYDNNQTDILNQILNTLVIK
jgi:hypothetical protein